MVSGRAGRLGEVPKTRLPQEVIECTPPLRNDRVNTQKILKADGGDTRVRQSAIRPAPSRPNGIPSSGSSRCRRAMDLRAEALHGRYLAVQTVVRVRVTGTG